MLVLLGIGLLAGAITAISPCVVPVLPILLAGGASGGRRRPYAIVAGLVGSFTLFTLFSAWLLGLLGLPQDLLRKVALGLLFLLAASLLVPPLGTLLERPFLPLTRRRGGDAGGGFLLGVTVGLVFVPCAGPVLAAVTAVAATQQVNRRTAALALAYALGAAGPGLVVAAGVHAVANRVRSSARRLRFGAGALIAAAALVIALGLDTRLQTALPGYTDALQARVESGAAADLRRAPPLPTYGRAPEFAGISRWLNGGPLTMAKLRGKVVLVDFWTYSCINCLRTLPHLEAWYAAYHARGLEIVGVHTPEFAFEHVPGNVEAAVKRLGIRYPVALDNDYATWDAWGNQYWPAEFLVDRAGRVRHAHFGEGDYGGTETTIRRLLGEPGPRARGVADSTPTGTITPETYLGYARMERYAGAGVSKDAVATYRFPKALPRDEIAFAGAWKVTSQAAVAGSGARLRLRFRARDVYVVLGGTGTVRALVNGRPLTTIRVDSDRLYTAVSGTRMRQALLELRLSPGVRAYSFTFG